MAPSGAASIVTAITSITTATIAALGAGTFFNWVWVKLGYITGNISLTVQKPDLQQHGGRGLPTRTSSTSRSR